MAEYTYKDIIIDPTSEEAKNAVGKEVYFADTPASCLNAAKNNNKAYLGYLKNLDLGDEEQPFYVNEFVVSAPSSWTCIIVKKEEPKPKYVPFKSNEEFLESYIYHKEKFTRSSLACQLYSLGGIWLKYKGIEDFFMITEFWDDMTRWGEFLERFTFLDGSPCGKEVEDKADK